MNYTYPDQWRHLYLASLPSHSPRYPCLCLRSAAESSCDPPWQLKPPGSLSAPLQGPGQGQSAPGWAQSSWDWAQRQYHCSEDSGNPVCCCFQLQCSCCHQKYRCRCPRESERDRRSPCPPLPLTSWTGSLPYPYLWASVREKQLRYTPKCTLNITQWKHLNGWGNPHF